jgi:PDZ domain
VQRICKLLLTGMTVGALLSVNVGVCTAQSADDPAPMLQGQVGAFGVLSDEIQHKMGLTVAANGANELAVSEVLPGSAASTCGIHPGDRVLDAHLQGNALNITIARNGTIFRAHLKEVAPKTAILLAETPKRDNTPIKPFTLNAEQIGVADNRLFTEKAATDRSKPLSANSNQFVLEANQNLKLLANYNVELIVDRSMSMKAQDCPGGLSRWNWCGLQAADLARSLAAYVQSGLTIVPFATEYDVFEHATAQNIQYLFSNVDNQFGTRLFEPLAERLDNYFAHHKANSKPLVIVIVTDGLPVPKIEPQLVRNELINSSKKMTNPGDVTVIFCQIGGNDRRGQEYLLDLDQNLVAEGAKFHYVHTISFEELREAGLGPALAASIHQYAPPIVIPKAVPGKTKVTPIRVQHTVRRA